MSRDSSEDTAQAVVTWSDTADGVVTIHMRRPPANALGLPLIDGLNAALDDIDGRNDVSVVIVASQVPGFFAAGADIRHMLSIDVDAFKAYGLAIRRPLARLSASQYVSIAAVEGVAFGGGLELAMACTLRVGSRNSSFGLPEVKIGLIPGAGGTQRLGRLVGRGRALDIVLTGRQLDALEAHSIGLLDRMAEAGAAESKARELAHQLSALSQPALRAAIRTVEGSFDWTLELGLARESFEIQRLFVDGEAREGLTAFAEKRPPEFG